MTLLLRAPGLLLAPEEARRRAVDWDRGVDPE
jgi:hypothetical protein